MYCNIAMFNTFGWREGESRKVVRELFAASDKCNDLPQSWKIMGTLYLTSQIYSMYICVTWCIISLDQELAIM